MTADTSSEAVKALIARAQSIYEDADPASVEAKVIEVAAALLDERDAAASFNASAHEQAQQRIRELESEVERQRRINRSAELQLQEAEAERDRLTAKLDRKRLIHVLWDQVPEDWDENDIGILADAILADTDEGSSK